MGWKQFLFVAVIAPAALALDGGCSAGPPSGTNERFGSLTSAVSDQSSPGEDLINVSVTSNGAGTLDAFAIGESTTNVYHRRWNGQQWAPTTGWQVVGGYPFGAQVFGKPALAVRGKQIDLFVGNNYGVFHKYWDGQTLDSSGNAVWNPSSWETLDSCNPCMVGSPAAAASSSTRVDLVYVGADGNLYRLWQDSSISSAWNPSGAPERLSAGSGYGFQYGSPAITSWGTNRLDVFVVGPSNGLYHKAWNGSQWQPATDGVWDRLPGYYTGTPAAASWGPGRVDVFAVGNYDGALYHYGYDGTNFMPSTGELLGGRIVGSPTVTSWGSNRLDIAVTGADDGAFYHKAWDPTQGGWVPSMTGYDRLGGKVIGSPTAVSWGPQRYDLMVTGSLDGQIYHKRWDPTHGWWPCMNCDTWEPLGAGIPASPTVVGRATGTAPWLVLKCKFHDLPNQVWTGASDAAIQQMFTTAGSGQQDYSQKNIVDYWNVVSNGFVDISGSFAPSGWATLPAGDTTTGWSSAGTEEYASECVKAWGYTSSLQNYYGVVVIMNGSENDLGCLEGRRLMHPHGVLPAGYGAVAACPGPMTNGNTPFVDGSHIQHEMGHGFGLTHAHATYDASVYPNTYAQNWDDEYGLGCPDPQGDYGDGWDVMGNFFGSIQTPNGLTGPSLNAVHLLQLGWMETARRFTYIGGTPTVTLVPVNLPNPAAPSGEYRVARVPIKASAQHYYTVELMSASNMNAGIAGNPVAQVVPAVVIHEVNALNDDHSFGEMTESVLRARGNVAGYQPGDSFNDGIGNVNITVVSYANQADPMNITAQVQIGPAH
jgi:hypothetical protein